MSAVTQELRNEKTFDFENVNQIQKKAVRGLLRKRAKKYDSESERDSDPSDNEQSGAFRQKRERKVVRKTMASAFKMIMAKKLGDEADEPTGAQITDVKVQSDAILAKYKKKARDLDEAKAKEEVERKKAAVKEKQRLMGRRIPTKEDAEKERSLAIVATKGVVQLFNAVAEFQTSVTKEANQDLLAKKKIAAEKIQDVGKDKQPGMVSFNSQAMIEKIQSTQRKWKVLESDSEDIDGNIKIMDNDDY